MMLKKRIIKCILRNAYITKVAIQVRIKDAIQAIFL